MVTSGPCYVWGTVLCWGLLKRVRSFHYQKYELWSGTELSLNLGSSHTSCLILDSFFLSLSSPVSTMETIIPDL